MRILSVLLMALCLSSGYITSSVAADIATPAQQEVQKHFRKGPRHHRGMSMAMMKDLDLSAAQKAKWKEISEQKKAETAGLREQMEKLHEQERKINDKYEAKIKKILDEEQLKKYESMLQKRPERPHNKHPMSKKDKD